MKTIALIFIAIGVWSIAYDINSIAHGLMPAKCAPAQVGGQP